jgi:hypothetical protein
MNSELEEIYSDITISGLNIINITYFLDIRIL